MLSYLETNNYAVGRHWWPLPEISLSVKLKLALSYTQFRTKPIIRLFTEWQ